MSFRKYRSTRFTIETCKEGNLTNLVIDVRTGNILLNFRSQNFKDKIVDILTKEGENWIGCGMTYTLFEFIKEQPELFDQLEEESKNASAMKMLTDETKAVHLAPVIKTTETVIAKKEQMTKNQKRRLWDRTNNKGERERGWNWVDIIRHLSSTGNKEETQEVVAQLAPPPNN